MYKRQAETAAALWAAKEAFGKAMGVGLSGWAMPEAAVAYGETGAPYFTLSEMCIRDRCMW